MVNSLMDAVKEIVSFCQFNPSSNQYIISNSYKPTKIITISDIKDIIKKLPNEYNILNENCQKFCQKIITLLNLKIQN